MPHRQTPHRPIFIYSTATQALYRTELVSHTGNALESPLSHLQYTQYISSEATQRSVRTAAARASPTYIHSGPSAAADGRPNQKQARLRHCWLT